MHRKGRGADFYAVMQAGQNFSDGISIYSTSPRQQIVPYYYPYRYHPFVAYTFGQLALLATPGAAYGIWIIILEFLLIANLIMTWKFAGDEHTAAVAMGLWLLFSPLYLEFYLGQFSFVMASLMFWSLVAWERKRLKIGDGWWILSLVVKSNSVIFAPVLLKQRRWKPVSVAVAAVLLLAVPYFLSVEGTYQEFARNYTERMSMKTILGNQGFAGLIGVTILRGSNLWTDDLHRLHANMDQMDSLMELPLLLWTVLVLLVTILITVKARREQASLLFLLWILSYFLFYKHVWEHQYVMLLPVFVLLYHKIRNTAVNLAPAVFWGAFSAIALPTIFLFIDISPVLGDPEIYWEPWKSLIFHFPKPFAVLVLYITLSFVILRESKSLTTHQLPVLSL